MVYQKLKQQNTESYSTINVCVPQGGSVFVSLVFLLFVNYFAKNIISICRLHADDRSDDRSVH